MYYFPKPILEALCPFPGGAPEATLAPISYALHLNTISRRAPSSRLDVSSRHAVLDEYVVRAVEAGVCVDGAQPVHALGREQLPS
jgi:hypothetical protein